MFLVFSSKTGYFFCNFSRPFPIIWSRRNGFVFLSSNLSCPICPSSLTPHFPYIFYKSLPPDVLSSSPYLSWYRNSLILIIHLWTLLPWWDMYISQSSAFCPTVQTLAPIQSSTYFSQRLFSLPLFLFLILFLLTLLPLVFDVFLCVQNEFIFFK